MYWTHQQIHWAHRLTALLSCLALVTSAAAQSESPATAPDQLVPPGSPVPPGQAPPPAQAVPPGSPADANPESEFDFQIRVGTLIEQLDGSRFNTRQKAEQELLRIGQRAVPAVQAAIKQANGEAKVRLQRVLTELQRSIRLVEIVERPELSYVVSVQVSNDGKQVYSAAWQAKTISTFDRDASSGTLTLQDSQTDDALDGVVALRLSPNNQLAATASFRTKTVTLLRRNTQSGKLTQTDSCTATDGKVALAFPIEVAFSPDSRFLHVLDCSFEAAGSEGAIHVFRVTAEGTLELVESNPGQRGCFDNARGIVFHPTLNMFYVTSSTAGTLTTVKRDPDTGQTFVQQVLRDGADGIQGLAGVMSAAITADGKFLYTSAGRFHGDNAVGAYTIDETGQLKVLQELIAGRDPLGQFSGGNELLVSPDGKNVYVSGTRSATLTGFDRDPETGKLQFIETVPLGNKKLGPAGVAIDPSGKYVYVAVEGNQGIAVFRRESR